MQGMVTLGELAVLFILTFVIGFPFTKLLLPPDIEKSFGTYITPTVGYLVFCLVAFTVSSSFKLATVTSCWGTFGLLMSFGTLILVRYIWRGELSGFNKQAKHSVFLMLPMALVILLPLFYFGAKAYFGAVNPDFFSGVIDNYFLLKGNSVTDFRMGQDSYFPIEYMAGSISASARFGAGVFGLLTQVVFHETIAASLSLSIGFFLLNIPLVIYFFSSVVLGFNRKQATLAGLLMGVSGPLGMSYLYYYLGQNSGLPALPLVMSAAYIMLMRPNFRTILLCAILTNALFINYFAMLPYALAPAGILGLYLLLSLRLRLITALGIAVSFVGLFTLFHIGNLSGMVTSMQAWFNVIGQTLQGQFFLEFLTELFFPFFFGVVGYPIHNSWITSLYGIGVATSTAFIMTAAMFVFWLGAIIKWIQNTKDIERKVFIVAALVIYAAVWWVYSFPRQYAYAVFKMSSWLQFILMPFIAYGLVLLSERFKKNGLRNFKPRKIAFAIPLGLGVGFVSLNLLTCLQYSYNGFGRNTVSGYIVNNFEMSGNKDYFSLKKSLAKFIPADQSVAILFVDSIQNYWVSYYLREMRQSIPFHQEMPGDDENLPDITTNTVMDYYGDLRKVKDPFAHNYDDSYFLTWNQDHLNRDIVDPNYNTQPIWQSHTFRLYDGQKLSDILATGRGFYRLEYLQPNKHHWFPKIIRWSAHGGEFYLLKVKGEHKPYRFTFDAIAGYEAPTDARTLELWINGKKFQTLTLTHAARLISKPFYPLKGANKIVILIKDKNRTTKRLLALWNSDIPTDYRLLNVAFANAKIMSVDSQSIYKPVPLAQSISAIQMFDLATAFNGIQLDGWVGQEGSISFLTPLHTNQVEINGFLPGVFNFPYKLSMEVNGIRRTEMIAKAGDFTIKIPISAKNNELNLLIKPSQVRETSDYKARRKVVKQSLLIRSITFT